MSREGCPVRPARGNAQWGCLIRAPRRIPAAVHRPELESKLRGCTYDSVYPANPHNHTAAIERTSPELAAEGLADSCVYALHARLAQSYADAMHDGLAPKSPCSRRTSPKAGKQRPYAATTEQVWAFHDAMPDHLRPAILLGAFVGLRLAETCGLRTTDIDFMRGMVHPAIQYPERPR